jgi:hypothetical protein
LVQAARVCIYGSWVGASDLVGRERFARSHVETGAQNEFTLVEIKRSRWRRSWGCANCNHCAIADTQVASHNVHWWSEQNDCRGLEGIATFECFH